VHPAGEKTVDCMGDNNQHVIEHIEESVRSCDSCWPGDRDQQLHYCTNNPMTTAGRHTTESLHSVSMTSVFMVIQQLS
jgi:hypothetical protein